MVGAVQQSLHVDVVPNIVGNAWEPLPAGTGVGASLPYPRAARARSIPVTGYGTRVNRKASNATL